jgi:hypothetical protein
MVNEEHLKLDPFPNSVKLGEKWKSGGNCGDDIYLLGLGLTLGQSYSGIGKGQLGDELLSESSRHESGK